MKYAAFLLLIFPLLSHSQSTSELLKQINDTDDDSLKVSLYGKLAITHRRNNPDSGFFYARKSLALARLIENKRSLAAAYQAQGILHFYQSNYDSAIWNYNEAYNTAIKLQDSVLIGAMLNNIGQTYVNAAKYDTAIELMIQSRQIRDQIGDERITSSINNIGNAYFKMGDFDRALDYYKEAAELKEKYGQTLSLSNTLNNIGIILKNQGKSEEAIPYYHKSLDIAEEYDDRNKLANAHNNIGTLYLDIDDFEKSEFHLKKSIDLKKEMGDKAGLYNSYNTYAELLSETNRFSEALQYIRLAELLEEQIGTTMYTADGLLMKSYVLINLGRYKEAYEVHQQAYLAKIEQVNEDRNQKIAEWEAKFENAQKEAEIARLSLETDLQRAQLYNSRIILFVGGGCSLLVMILIVIIYQQRLKKKKAEQEAQDLQIEALEKRLIDLNIIPSEPTINASELNSKIHTPLSDREFEVLRLSLEGKSNMEISDVLFISISTVKFHLRNTYGKLGVNNRKEALDYVVKSS
ncbi:tetratricopeptide repeat protein [Ekhidna sp.]|uniref:tetratricopeptide repeat protein n=1 Tax=Ekhidna sp. TaxID=2608089 RepID=UPI0032EC2DE5